jgi:hypothetical protein
LSEVEVFALAASGALRGINAEQPSAPWKRGALREGFDRDQIVVGVQRYFLNERAINMSPTRPRAKANIDSTPVSVDTLSAAPQMFLAQSARAALFGLDAFEANLQIWRSVSDALNEVGRRQQDAVLESFRERLSTTSAAPIAAAADPAPLVAPFEAVRTAYEIMGDAVLAVQRRTLEGLSGAASTH